MYKTYSSDAGASGKRSEAQPRKIKTTTFPTIFEPNEANRILANELGLNIDHEARAFADYYVGRGIRAADWNRLFSAWLRNAGKKIVRRPKKKKTETFDALAALRAALK